MREIKFRVWGNWRSMFFKGKQMQDKQEMFYDKKRDIESFFRIIRHKCISWKTMQFTGLKDKNGKEIFEGDIVIFNNGYQKVVEYEFCEFDNGDCIGFNIHSRCEVIGNKFENPKLLKR